MIPLPDRPQVASAGDVLGEAPQHHGRKSSPPTATSKSAHRASVGDFSAFTGQQHTMPHIGSSSASCTQASHPPSSFSNGKQNRNRLSITRFSASGSSLMGYMAAAHHHQHSKELPAEVIASGYDVRAPDFESMLANDDLVVKVDLDSAARLDGGVEEPPLRHMEQLPHQVSTGLLGIGVTTVTTQVEQHFAPPPSMIGTPSSFLAPNLGHGELTEAQKVMLDYTSQAPASSPLRSHPSSPASGAFPGITATPSYAAGTGSLRSHWDFENVPRARVSPGTGFFTIDALDRATTGQELDAPVKRSKKSFFRRPSINIGTVFSEPNPGAKSKRDPLSPAANVSGFASASDVQHGAIHRSTSANNLFGKVLVDEPVQPYSTRPYVHGGVSSNSSDLLHQKQHASNEHESKNAYSDLVGSSASLPRAFPPQPHSADSRYLGNHSASESNSSFPSPHTQRIEEARSGTRSESPSLHKHSQPASASSSTKSRGRIQKLKTSFGRKVSSSKSNKSTSEDDDLRTPAAASFVSPLAGSSGRKSSRSRGREAAQDELVFVLAQRHARQVSSQLPEQDVFSILPHPQSGFLHRLGLALDSEKEEMSPTCSASTTSGRTPHSDSRSTFGSSEYSLTTPAGSTDSHVFGSQGHYLSERRRSSIRSHDPSPGFDLRGDEDGKEVMYSPPRPFMDSAQGAITTRPRQAQRPRSRPRTRAGEVADEEQASMPSLPSSAMTASSDTRSLSSVEAANRSTDSLGSSSHSEQRIGRAPPSQAPVATSQQKYPPTSLPTSFVRPPRHRPPLPTAEAPAVPMRRKNMDTRSTMTNFAGSSAPRRRVKMQLVPTELLAQGGGVMKAGVKSGHAVLDRDGELMYIAKRAKGLAAGGGVRTVLHRGCATGPALMRSHQSAFANFKTATLQRVKHTAASNSSTSKNGAPWVGSIHRADMFGQRWSFRLPSNRELVRMDAGGLGLGLGTGVGLGLNLDPLAAAAAAKEEQEQENGTSFFDLDDDADSSEMEEGDSKYGGDEMLLPGSAVASDLGHGLAAGGNATKQRARATSLLEATARHHPRFAAAAGGSATAAGAGIITAETNHATVSAQGLKEGTRVFEWVGAHVIKLVECESAASGSTTGGAVRDRVVAVFTRDVKDSKGAGELEMDSEFPDTEALILTLLHVLDWHIHGSLKYGA